MHFWGLLLLVAGMKLWSHWVEVPVLLVSHFVLGDFVLGVGSREEDGLDLFEDVHFMF